MQEIYEHKDVEKAREDFVLWCKWVRRTAGKKGKELLKPMVKVAEMVEGHLEGILGYWKGWFTNG